MTTLKKPSSRPPIVLSETDAERLSGLAIQNEAIHPVAAKLLLSEIARAHIRPDVLVRDNIVGMNSTVEFRDEAHGRDRVVQLVYPQDADIAAGKVSILTPVGAGLIGLTAGQAILWPDREGEKRVLRILRVVRYAETA